jgi:voltage-gated potassium channel Kch
MLHNLSKADLESVIKTASTDPSMPEIVSEVLADNPGLLNTIVRAVGRNAEATEMLGRAAKTLK